MRVNGFLLAAVIGASAEQSEEPRQSELQRSIFHGEELDKFHWVSLHRRYTADRALYSQRKGMLYKILRVYSE
jgi:hypothetical protein